MGNTKHIAPALDHERLIAYQVGVALDEVVARIVKAAPRGHGWICDQLQEACGSAVLNIAESVGRKGADRANRVRIPRGSLLETDAAVTLLVHRGACSPALRDEAHRHALRLAPLLEGFLKSALR